jgi:enoyl-CoA hydratase/carnithine racemase
MTTTVTYAQRKLGDHIVGDLHLASANGYNPMSTATVAALRAELKRVDLEGSAHVVTLSSTGRAFSAGADLKEIRAKTVAELGAFISDTLALFDEMMAFSKPIIAVVHADALGAGAALAQFADFVIASDSARFGFPEALAGLAAPGYMTPRLMGRQMAAEMALTGARFSAQRMADLGQVNVVCAPEGLEAAVQDLVQRLAQVPASALALGKRSLRNGMTLPLREAMDCHVVLQMEALQRARAEGRF